MGHKHLLVTVQCLCHNYFSCTLVPFSVLPFAPAFPAVSLQEFPFPPLGGCRLPAFLPFPSVCPPLLTPPSEQVYHTLLENKTLLSYPSREGQEKKPLFSWLNSGPCWSILPWGVNCFSSCSRSQLWCVQWLHMCICVSFDMTNTSVDGTRPFSVRIASWCLGAKPDYCSWILCWKLHNETPKSQQHKHSCLCLESKWFPRESLISRI